MSSRVNLFMFYGRKLGQARVKAGLTLQQFAKKIGRDSPSVHRWETTEIASTGRGSRRRMASALKMTEQKFANQIAVQVIGSSSPHFGTQLRRFYRDYLGMTIKAFARAAFISNFTVDRALKLRSHAELYPATFQAIAFAGRMTTSQFTQWLKKDAAKHSEGASRRLHKNKARRG